VSKKKQPDTTPEAAAAALWEAINACPPESRGYLLNFVGKNAHRPLPEMLERMTADIVARAEAETVQRHRDERVLTEALDAAKRLGIEVAITGVPAGAETETVDAKG
jgi:hypothetical protein